MGGFGVCTTDDVAEYTENVGRVGPALHFRGSVLGALIHFI